VSLIGAVDACAISNMPADDARSDIINDDVQPFELSGTGEITDGKVHLHVVPGREGDGALAGHLHWAKVETFSSRPMCSPCHGHRDLITSLSFLHRPNAALRRSERLAICSLDRGLTVRTLTPSRACWEGESAFGESMTWLVLSCGRHRTFWSQVQVLISGLAQSLSFF
jgi:hypothetical protein